MTFAIWYLVGGVVRVAWPSTAGRSRLGPGWADPQVKDVPAGPIVSGRAPLLELCARFRVLLSDSEGLYDPTEYADRLLPGLTGVMNEAELHVLKNRMVQGKRNKASRGELVTGVPAGYVKAPSGEVTLDPDELAQGVIQLIFDPFDRQGTVHGV